VLLAVVLISACAAELQHDLDERSANDTVTTLAGHGVAAEKVRQGRTWTVTVPAGEHANAWRIVRESGLDAREPAGQEHWLPSPAERRSALAAQTARDLEGSLQLLEGVTQARVHLILPATVKVKIPGAEPVPARASVLLRVSRADPAHVSQVRQILAGAVENLASDDIHVVTVVRSQVLAPEVELVPMGPFTVSAQSALGLRVVVGGLIAAVLVLATAVCFLVARRRGWGRA